MAASLSSEASARPSTRASVVDAGAGERAATNLANNIRALRELRKLTQQQLAQLSSVPRPTVANLETGGSNPTLGVLVKIATALGVSIEELILAPRSSAKHYPAGSLPGRMRGKVKIQKLLPDPIIGLEIERFELPVGAKTTGAPHTPGSREYFTCEQGEIELAAAGDVFRLGPGDVVAFRGDQHHSYVNCGRRLAVAYSVVALAPAPV